MKMSYVCTADANIAFMTCLHILLNLNSFQSLSFAQKRNVTPQLIMNNNLVFVISLHSHHLLYIKAVSQLLVTYPNPEVIITSHTA